jgi:hypothetical protein
MNDAAYVISQSVCAMIEAMGMQAENQQRIHRGESVAYMEDSFNSLCEKYGIHHNAVCTVLQGR